MAPMKHSSFWNDSPLNRRQFIRTGAVGACSLAQFAGQPGHSAEPKRPRLVDTHLHCFAGRNDPRFPYHERAPYRPEEKASPEHLLKCMDEGGIDFAVVVTVAALARKPPGRLIVPPSRTRASTSRISRLPIRQRYSVKMSSAFLDSNQTVRAEWARFSSNRR